MIRDHLKGKTIVVLVYSPMCGYCAAMRNEWTDAARKMAGEGMVVVDMDVRNTIDDSMPLPRIASEGMAGVPHLVAIRNNSRFTFDGERTSPAMLAWAKSVQKLKPVINASAPQKPSTMKKSKK